MDTVTLTFVLHFWNRCEGRENDALNAERTQSTHLHRRPPYLSESHTVVHIHIHILILLKTTSQTPTTRSTLPPHKHCPFRPIIYIRIRASFDTVVLLCGALSRRQERGQDTGTGARVGTVAEGGFGALVGAG